MSSRFLSKLNRLLVVPALILGIGLGSIALAAGVSANVPPVQTYPDQPTPPDGYYDSPLAAGTLTLQEVLEAHRPATAQAPKLPAIGGTPSATTTAPILTPPVQSSATSMMMSQGMKEVLQKVSGAPATSPAPVPPAQPAGQPVALTPAAAPSASGVQYEPGQEPKNLASCCASGTIPLAAASPVATPLPAVSPEASPTPAASANQACDTNVQKWEKSCGEAGYPSTFVGKIVGETRTGCSDGALHDVWVTNSCAPPDTTAQTAKTDGVCGAASNNEFDDTPAANLCGQGIASAVSGDGPWTWACSGVNGGEAAACTAHKRVAPTNGACGTANGAAASSAPSSGLCDVGTASVVKGDGPWTWSCKGAGKGRSESCIAPVAARVASIATPTPAPAGDVAPVQVPLPVPMAVPVASAPAPVEASSVEERPSPKSVPSVTAETAPSLHADASDTKTEGGDLCGEASETLAYEAPQNDLCRAGTASAVNGDGPWNWSCTTNEGLTSSCRTLSLSNNDAPATAAAVTAPATTPAPAATATPKLGKTKKSAKQAPQPTPAPEAAATSPSEAPATPAAPPPAPDGTSPAVAGILAQTESTSAATPTPATAAQPELACGVAATQPSQLAPTSDLCQGGKAGAVRGSNPWTWTCSKGKHKLPCSTPKMVDAACGAANGAALKSAPFAGLCASGSPSGMSGDGPWTWSCSGSGGGTDVSCAATVQTKPDKIDGACGTSSGANLKSAPSEGLCNNGSPSGVNGEGPWTWSCSGTNGGKVDSCSATKVIPPKPPGPAVNGLCGSANGMTSATAPSEGLCSTGTVSDIVGNGPWNWSCLGENGGMTVSCTAPLNPPAPIDGACGAASGVATLVLPQSGLCSSGITGTVNGKGPWTWTCSGANGGDAASCIAPYAGKSSASSATAPSSNSYVASGTPSSGLVTPRLPSSANLPPMDANVLPSLTKSKSFATAPAPSNIPAPVTVTGDAAPQTVPELPQGSEPVQPPTFKEALPSAPVLQENPIEPSSRLPGNHLTLDPTISTILFTHGSDNIDDSVTMTLDKLANVLQTNPDVRISLMAYADSTGSTPRDARRISLKRALAVRGYLSSKGITESRIDVHAEGANAATGYLDRVDVKIND